ncbi:CLUMA_CG012131, isoform A [Clunio marinus]|uniref:Diphthine--ammonia ligase n=1 Tax=Clunio marinus TaxID=568069 RepID=A0A1J1IFH5_9DIPT|nr:CLUMA_CG012131, isoform A [Clunio marinus]
MKVVALVSGGKDSTFNMLCCQSEGHEIVALANLHPADKDELDSFMYQTVGHMGIEMLAEAMELPLYRKTTSGLTTQKGKIYEPTEDDEVEDLYELLKQVKDEMQIEAVSVGAIFSDYQRVRCENVCSRLNLTSLAYLWRRDQGELLQEMIDCQLEAIIIKVASLGLTPERHLGKSIRDMQGHLLKMHDKYGVNICGEGGEYETFTLDCPLFKKRIVIDDHQVIISSSDPVCPVGYINFTKLHLEAKEPSDFKEYVIKNSLDFINELNSSSYSDLSDPDLTDTELEFIEKENFAKHSGMPSSHSGSLAGNFSRSQSMNMTKNNSLEQETLEEMKFEYEQNRLENQPHVVSNSKGWHWISSIQGEGETTKDGVEKAMNQLEEIILEHSMKLNDICYITIYVRDISEYSILNDVYIQRFNFQNPPTRVCVETCLPHGCHIIMEAVAFKTGHVKETDYKRHTMHVQGISHWAPANIGPYSQSTKIGEITYISGQIGLIPGNMKVISGGIKQECKLILRHINRIAKAMNSHGQLRDVVQGICFVTHPSYISEARRQWERRTANAIMDYIVVPGLPRKALVEWQVWIHTHNNKFEYEETGCSVGNQYVISIRRRWNYENNCAAIICYVSTGQTSSSTKLTDMTDEMKQRHETLMTSLNESHLDEIMQYNLSKIMQGYPKTTENVPAIHFRIFYQVMNPSPANLIIKTMKSFKDATKTANIAFTVIPSCYLQNYGTFISICGVRHE